MNTNILSPSRFIVRLANLLACFALPFGVQAASLTWDADTSTSDVQDGSGTWTTGAGGWWNGSANVNWTAGDIATFGAGTDGSYTINIGGAISAGTPLTFNNSGYTLTAASPQTVTPGITLTVAAGKSMTIGTNVTVTRSGGFTWNGGGLLNVAKGGVLKNSSGNSASISGGTTIDVMPGGTFQNTGSSASSLIIGGDSAGGILYVNGGTTTVQGNFILNNSSGGAVVTLTNGANVSVTTVANAVRFGGSTGSGTLNLDGGTLTTPRVFENAASVSSTNNLNGGVLRALTGTTSAANFMTGLDRANVRDGGAVFDPNGQSITIGQNLTHSIISGDNEIDGGLTIVGSGGTVTLTGTNTYTGPTIINGSVLGISAPYNKITATTVNSGGRLKVTVNTTPSDLTSLTLNDGGGLQLDLGVYNAGNAPGISTASLNVSGNNVIDIAGGSIPVGDITLLTYTTKSGTSTFTTGNLPPGVVGTVTDTGTSLVLHVTSPSGNTYVWSAGNGDWDFTTPNWNSGASVYSEAQTALVTFPDSAVGSVNITASVHPFSVGVTANTGSYAFTGTGSIDGAASLFKAGAKLLTLSSSNSYSGVTSVSGGAIIVTADSALGNTNGGTTVATASTLALSGGVNYSTAEPLTLTGPGAAGSQFFAGSATQRGALQSISGDNIWAGNITITPDSNIRIGVQDGARLTLAGNITESTNGLNLFFRAGNSAGSDIVVSGTNNNWTGETDIYGGGGAALRLGVDNGLPKASLLRVGIGGIGGNTIFDLHGFNQEVAGLIGDGTVGVVENDGDQPSTLTINPNPDQVYPGIIQDGLSSIGIVKNGAFTEILSGTSTYTGPTVVNGGSLRVTGSLGATPVSVNAGAYLDGTGTIGGPVTINASGTLESGGGSIGTLTINNDLTITGNLTFKVDKSQTASNDLVIVSGGLTNAGTGTLTINNVGANALAVGDSFMLFSQAVSNGLALTINGPAGVTFTNNLAVDGSIAVSSLSSPTADYPTNITISVSGSTLGLTWPETHLGWYAQSNSVSLSDPAQWFDVANSQNGTNLNITIDPTLPNVFYRLRHP